MREYAISALQRLSSIAPPAMDALVLRYIHLLQGGVKGECVVAASGLSTLGAGASAAIPALLHNLDHPDAGVRDWTLSALQKVSQDARLAVPYLFAALRDPDQGVRAHALGSLRQLDPNGVVPALLQLLQSSANRDLRIDSVRAIAQGGATSHGAPAALIPLLADSDPAVREIVNVALDGLCRTAPSELLSPLLSALQHPDKRIRIGAAARLKVAALHNPSAFYRVRQALAREPAENQDVRAAMAEALASICLSTNGLGNAMSAIPEALVAFAAIIRDPTSKLRLAAIEAIGAMGSCARAATSDLLAALRDDDPHIRDASAAALAKIAPPAADTIRAL